MKNAESTPQQPTDSKGRLPGETGREFLARRATEAIMHREAVVTETRDALHAVADTAEAERDKHLADLLKLPQQNETTLGPLWPSH